MGCGQCCGSPPAVGDGGHPVDSRDDRGLTARNLLKLDCDGGGQWWEPPKMEEGSARMSKGFGQLTVDLVAGAREEQ